MLLIEFSEEDLSMLDDVFSGYQSIPSTEDFLTGLSDRFLKDAGIMYRMRLDYSISGAMRWPFSQEAAIRVKTFVL